MLLKRDEHEPMAVPEPRHEIRPEHGGESKVNGREDEGCEPEPHPDVRYDDVSVLMRREYGSLGREVWR